MSASSPKDSRATKSLSWVLIGLLFVLIAVNVAVFGLMESPTEVPETNPSEPITDGEPTVEEASVHWDEINLERIHSWLLPSWAIARINGSDEQTQELREELLAELNPNPKLVELFLSLEASGSDPESTTTEQFVPICWAWNQYLDRHQAPWRIRCIQYVVQEHTWFYINTYQVVADVIVDIEDEGHRVRLLRRMDRNGARENYLGHTGTEVEGALLVLDRIRDFALDDLWPLLDSEPAKNSPPYQVILGPAVRSDIQRVVGSEHMTVLSRTAGARKEMLNIWSDLAPIRDCLELSHLRLPWSGPTKETLSQFKGERTRQPNPCPEIPPKKLGRLLQITDDLAKEGQLVPALDHLLAWAARPVVLHEAQHLADRRPSEEQGPLCPRCSSNLSESEQSELSAYMATLAHPALANTARLQACVALEQLPEDSVHAQALGEILRSGLDGMCDQPLNDFDRLAVHAQALLLGRTSSGTIPTDFPRRLPVALEPPKMDPSGSP